MHRSRLTSVLLVAVLLLASVSMTSCGGGSGAGSNPDLVLLGFSVPNLSGIPLNAPLIFTFSAPINAGTITPDSLRVVGTAGPFFESTVVDGNLVALLPTVPNFADYSDAGLQPDIEYTVSLTEFPAVTTIESTSGKPLLQADTFTFRTLPAKSADIVSNIRCNGPDGILGTPDDTTPGSPSFFVEPRRSIRHGTGYVSGGKSDDDGCLQNSTSGNTLYLSPLVDPTALQAGSGVGARLLCMQNEGSPRVIEPLSIPTHDQRAFGTPSAVEPGLIDLPAIRVRMNEPLDPLTVEPFFAGIPVNVQLWRVALKNGDFTGPDQISTNKPIVVQSTEDSEIILVPAGPVPQGIYLINITPSVKDLPGCPLLTNSQDALAPSSTEGGYDVYEGEPGFGAAIPPGYRIYFHTLQVPDTPLSIVEDFVNNISEQGDNQSGTNEPGLYTHSVPDLKDTVLDGLPLNDTYGAAPNATHTFDAGGDPFGVLGGQTTTAAWNTSGTVFPGGAIADVHGYRFLNLPSLVPNLNPSNPGPGRLRAVHQPWLGNGGDGPFDSNGADIGWNTDSGSTNGDGIWEMQSFRLRQGDTLIVTGSKPLLILCQGDWLCEGTILLNGKDGGEGFDTDETLHYTNTGAASSGGAGGAGGPGGSAGGSGTDPLGVDAAKPPVTGVTAAAANSLYAALTTAGGSGGSGYTETVAGANDGSQGGGGGGFSANGDSGSTSIGNLTGADGGLLFGDSAFTRDLALFQPNRSYHPMAGISGGSGGAGGGMEDDDGASEVGDGTAGAGDDGGAGGGGGGGAIWVIARGNVTVASTGVINANGGAGGSVYSRAHQLFDDGADEAPGGTDDIFLGLDTVGAPSTGSGQAGPGGGGAGGGIFLCGLGSVTTTSGASLSATAGLGGTSDELQRIGGDGSLGRILLTTFAASASGPSIAGGTTNPAAPGAPARWNPTIDQMSVGQSEWVDLFTNNTVFAPRVPPVIGAQQFPTFHANFTLDLGNPGFLELPVGNGGGGQVQGIAGGTFDAAFEFQGADLLDTPTPDLGTPTRADGLTPWFDVSNVEMINNKRYFRWRWRFWAKDGYGGDAGDPANLPLPSVFDLTIPFVKNS